MYKKFLFILLSGVISAARADDCIDYKLTPKIVIDSPDWTKEVVQPLSPMDLLHGNVIATMVDNYDIIADITPIEDGFCVGLKSVNATIGYSDFLVQIDIRHVPDSCSYNAILSHEDQHIRAYLSVIDDFKADLNQSVYSAADAVMPIFVPLQSDIPAAVDKLNEKLQQHPDVVLIKQKIKAAEEIRNKRVDEYNNSDMLKKCFE